MAACCLVAAGWGAAAWYDLAESPHPNPSPEEEGLRSVIVCDVSSGAALGHVKPAGVLFQNPTTPFRFIEADRAALPIERGHVEHFDAENAGGLLFHTSNCDFVGRGNLHRHRRAKRPPTRFSKANLFWGQRSGIIKKATQNICGCATAISHFHSNAVATLGNLRFQVEKCAFGLINNVVISESKTQGNSDCTQTQSAQGRCNN